MEGRAQTVVTGVTLSSALLKSGTVLTTLTQVRASMSHECNEQQAPDASSHVQTSFFGFPPSAAELLRHEAHSCPAVERRPSSPAI